jgi:hypothetical protein
MRNVLLALMGIATLTASAQTPETGRIRGAVRFASSELPRATVQLKDAAGKIQEAVTDPHGVYEFGNLPPGSYSLTIEDPKTEWGNGLPPMAFDQQPRMVTLAPGDAVVIDLAVRLKPFSLTDGLGMNAIPIELPLCGSFPDGPSLIATSDGFTIRMRPGDPPLKVNPAEKPIKIEKPPK